MPPDPKLALTVFRAVLECDEADRRDYLARACGGDVALRREVDALLRHHEASTDFLRTDAIDGWIESASGTFDAASTPTLGGYRGLQRIGEGGMGVVYRATQHHPRREVALKVLRLDSQNQELHARFERETQILAQLQHPGIAQVFDAGKFESDFGPVPYFSMELLHGLPLDEHCQSHALSPAERCELVARVCDAIQHAHERGVVHRDLKPSNILVCKAAGPVAQPKILDFGVARSLAHDSTGSMLHTRTGQVIGTLAYMSPEQASDRTVDHRTDVYSLGVLLFELLTRRLPLDHAGRSVREIQEALEHEEPPRLGAVAPKLRGDLEVVVEKALAKDPDRRYPTAAALADDLRRFLADRPVRARRLSAFYYLRKSARRHRVLVIGTVATLLALLAGTVATLVFAAKEVEARHAAQANAATAAQNEVRAVGALQQSVTTLTDSSRYWDAMRQLTLVPASRRGWCWHMLSALLPRELRAPPELDSNASDWQFWGEDTLGKCSGDGRVLVRSLGGGPPRSLFADERFDKVWSFGPRRLTARRGQEWFVLDWRQEAIVERFVCDPATSLRSVACSDDGRYVAIRRPGGMVDVRVDGLVQGSYPVGDGDEVQIAPDGQLLALYCNDGPARLIDIASGRALIPQPDAPCEGLGLRPFCGGALVWQWSLGDGDLRDTWMGRIDLVDGEFVRGKAVGPLGTSMVRSTRDGEILSVGLSGRARLLRSRTGEPALRSRMQTPDGSLPYPPNTNRWAAISPSGRSLLLTQGAQPCWVIDLDPRAMEPDFDPRCVTLHGHTSWIYHLAVSHDGAHVVSSAPEDPQVRVWDAGTGEQVATLARPALGVLSWDALLAFSADDARIVFTGPFAGGTGAGVVDWRWRSGEVDVDWPAQPVATANHAPLLDRFVEILAPGPGERLGHKAQMSGERAVAVWSEDADAVPPAPTDGGVHWRRLTAPANRALAALAVHPTRGEVAAVYDSQHPGWLHRPKTGAGILVQDAVTGATLRDVPILQRSLMCAAYSPDGSMLALGTRRGDVLILETAFYTVQMEFHAHRDYVYSLVWMPDGERLVTASGDETLRIWDPRRARR